MGGISDLNHDRHDSKELPKLNTQTNNPILKWADDANRHFTKDMRVVNEHMIVSVTLVTREREMKITMSCHYSYKTAGF